MKLLQTENCGVAELDGVGRASNPAQAQRMFLNALDEWIEDREYRPAFIIFSGVTYNTHTGRKPKYLQRFVSFIQENNLGTLATLEPRKNPNSGNTIQVYLWSPDYEALAAATTPK